MQSDDDFQTTLSKWPFILGDVLLVAAALAIAILGQWQLTNWQVAACVVSVALGAALFVLPYVVEFKVRIREESEDRSADLRVLHRQLVNTQDELGTVSERMDRFETGLADLRSAQSSLREALNEASRNQKGAEAAEAAATLRADLAALTVQVAGLVEQMAARPEEARPEEARPEEAADSFEAGLEPPEENSESPEEVIEAEAKPKKSREPRQRRRPEARLLHRAIDEKGDHSSAAVSRIIGSKKKEITEADESPEVPEVLEVPAEVDDLFAEAVPPQSPQRTRTKKSDTAVIASVFIGIGNKPYLRGSGGGLNWGTGVAMEFEEIGKWRWIAPVDLEEAVELQLYRNDEDPDTEGTHWLEPGQQLEVSPVF